VGVYSLTDQIEVAEQEGLIINFKKAKERAWMNLMIEKA
jgi:hypothetical protein